MKLFLALALLAVVSAVPLEYTLCGAGTATIKSVDVAPWPPVRGQNLHIQALATLADEVTGGQVSVSVYKGGSKLTTQKKDICKIDPKHYPCPIKAGDLTVDESIKLPKIVPKGEYDITVTSVDQDGTQLICVKMHMPIKMTPAALEENTPLTTPQIINYKNCHSGYSHFAISTVKAEPWPPVKGHDFTVYIDGTLDTAESKGNVNVKAHYLGIKVADENIDICTMDPEHPCPMQKGPVSLKYTYKLPSKAPPGTYTFDIKATVGDDNEEVLCMTMKTKMASKMKTPINDLELINHVNSVQTSWKAGTHDRFEGLDLDHISSLCGSLEGGPELDMINDVMNGLPENFDSRDKWGSMCPTVGEIRDQAACGSCWAFGAAEAMSDRHCIHSNGKNQYHLAAEDLVSCCGFFTCGNGCHGGYPSGAWRYWTNTGIVTGGNYNTGEGCWPYPVPSCEHHSNGTKPTCGKTISTPKCVKSCINGLDWEEDKKFGAKSYGVNGIDAIKTEIFNNGPVEGSFTVYGDFPTYKSGVYRHVSGSQLGGHAIKILGWGVENGEDYWLVANSWNEDWGDKGYFKIAMGQCGIENGVVAGTPQ